MLVIAFSVFLIVFVCLGYGGALYKVLRRIGFEGTATLPILLVFGVIALAFLTSVGCLFFPIAAVTQGILFAAGSILLYVSRRVVSDALRLERNHWSRAAAIVCGLAVAVALMYGATGMYLYDTGLYHAQAIRWIREYGTPLGLGNMHMRLAWHSILWPLEALFTFGNRGPYPFVPFLVSLLVLVSFRVALVSARRVLALLPIVIFFIVFLTHIASPGPDITLASLLLTALFLSIDDQVGAPDIRNAGVASVLSLALLTKPNAVPALIPFLAVIAASPKRLYLLGAAGLLAAAYVIRGVMLSGYVLYPATNISLPVEWQIPYWKYAALHVTAWARIPRMDTETVLALPYREWVPVWLASLGFFTKIVLVSSSGLGIVAVAALAVRKGKTLGRWSIASVGYVLRDSLMIWLLTAMAGIVLWFFAAPDPRFGMGYFLLAAAAALLVLGSDRPSFRWQLQAAFVVILSSCAAATFFFVMNFRGALIRAPRLPEVELKTVKYGDVNVYVPVSGDQCFAAPLPCTPYPAQNVIPRRDDISSGFRTLSH